MGYWWAAKMAQILPWGCSWMLTTSALRVGTLLRLLGRLSHLGKVSTALDEGLSGSSSKSSRNLQDHAHLQEWGILEWLVLSLEDQLPGRRGLDCSGEMKCHRGNWRANIPLLPGLSLKSSVNCFGMFHSSCSLTTIPAELGMRDGNQPRDTLCNSEAALSFLFLSSPEAPLTGSKTSDKLEVAWVSNPVEEPLYPVF